MSYYLYEPMKKKLKNDIISLQTFLTCLCVCIYILVQRYL